MKNKLMLVGTLLISLLLISGCSAKLKNGEEAAVKFNDGAISANDFYNILKEKYGEDEIVDAIDKYILDKEYANTKDNKDNSESIYINEQLDKIKDESETQKVDFDTYIKNYYNVNSESELKEFLALNYKRNKWVEDYLISKVSDNEIKKYYDEKIIGDMKLSHILISPDVSSNASDEEKEKAEKAAKKKAEEVIEEINNGMSFSEAASKYSDDESNKNNGGSLGYINREGYDENFVEGAIPLKKGKYTKEPVKSSFGYHIILKEDQKKKPKLDKVRDNIKETIAAEKYQNDSSLSYKALEALRDKYKMSIKDSKLKKAYKRAVDKLYNNDNEE